MKVDSRGTAGLVAFMAPVILLLPFAGKAFHIDDPLFLWMARRIVENPIDPFGLSVYWGAVSEPMFRANQNPPGLAYWLAATACVAGWSEVAMHISMALVAGAAGLGTYVLARELCSKPLIATFVAVLTPGFFVSATTVMSDVPMTALYVWSLALWVLGLKQNRQGLLLASSSLMGLAILVKYFAVTLLPLTFVYAIVSNPRARRWAWHYLAPIAIAAGYLVWGYWQYDVNLYTVAAEFALRGQWRSGRTPSTHLLTGIVFMGGCSASLALMAPFLWSRRALGYGFGIGAAFVGAFCVPSFFDWSLGDSGPFTLAYRMQVGIWTVAGVHIAALLAADLWRRRDAGAAMLACWIAGTFVFSVYVNHMINARTLLPMLPALGVLAVRRMDTLGEGACLRARWNFVSLSAAACLAVWVAAGDFEYANASRSAVQEFSKNRDRFSERVFFYNHWGFQYYMEQAGARPLEQEMNAYNAEFYRMIRPGDTVAVAHANSGARLDPATYPLIVEYAFPMRSGMRTMTSGAGFYCHFWGMLPFAAGSTVPEAFTFVSVP